MGQSCMGSRTHLLSSVRQSFASPPSGYAPFHFWMWNGDMRPEEIRRQIAGMRATGIEQFMICPTAGLELAYLGEEYLNRVELACREAKVLGMQVWLYDELNWPSGVVGGSLLASHPEYRMRFLACYGRHFEAAAGAGQLPLRFEEGELVLALAREASGSELDLRPQLDQFVRSSQREDSVYIGNSRSTDVAYREGYLHLPPGEWELRLALALPTRVLLSAELGTLGSPEVVGYLDTLNPEAVAEFIRLTHERYASAIGRYFGNVVPGIFTDEPTINRPHSVQVPEGWACSYLPWSRTLEPRLRDMSGHELGEVLPAMLFGEATEERSAFWRAVTQQYIESYHGQIRSWCHLHSLQYIGHMLGDDAPSGWVDCSGSLYAALSQLDIAGFDEVGPFPALFGEDDPRPGPLGPTPASYFSLPSLMGGKLASSVAHLEGRGACLAEGLALQGFRPGLADARAACNWLLALGVNRLLIAAMFYSQKAARKTTEPSLHCYHSPWWPYYGHLSAYVARLAFALAQGQHLAPVAMLVPDAALRSPAQRASAESGIAALAHTLFSQHLDFDFFTEQQALASGAFSGQDGCLNLGGETYHAVVLPPGQLAPALAEALAAFASEGGIVLGLPPGWPHDNGASLPVGQTLRAVTDQDLGEEVEAALGALRPALILDEGGEGEAKDIACLARSLGDGRLLFLANLSRSARAVLVRTRADCGRAELWEPETGMAAPLAQEQVGGLMQLRLQLAPGEGKLLALTTAGEPTETLPGAATGHRRTHRAGLTLPQEWRFLPQRPNAYPLRDWAVSPGPAGPWQDVAQGAAAMEPAARQGKPWVRARFRLDYRPQSLAVVGERGVVSELRLNGEALASAPRRSAYFDECSLEWDIAGQARAGENEIVARLDIPAAEWLAWYARPTLGCFFLTGDFAVLDERLQAQPAVLTLGSWADQGFPYYSGAAIYEQDLELSAAQLAGGAWLWAELWGGVLEVAVNGQTLAVRPWPPYRVDISAATRPGVNRLALTVTNTIANLMGDVVPSGLASVRLELEEARP